MKSILLLSLIFLVVSARICYRGVTNTSDFVPTMSTLNCPDTQACVRYKKPSDDVYVMDCDASTICPLKDGKECNERTDLYDLVCCRNENLCNQDKKKQ